jgi:hypothetical protein
MEKHLNSNLLGKALNGDMKTREYVNSHIVKCQKCKEKVQKITKEAWEELGGLEGAIGQVLSTPDPSAKSDKCLSKKQMIDLIYNKKKMYEMFSGILYDEKNKKIKDETLSHIIGCSHCKPTFFNYLYAQNIIYLAEQEKEMKRGGKIYKEFQKYMKKEMEFEKQFMPKNKK